ncbi:MAG: HAD family phosphatase, partial [Bacteroidales bacterium]|nr:HAD family phosphatase [Bacteroidales bacterium]
MKKKYDFSVIFDMDGTLLDNSEYHKQAWLKFLRKHNINMSEAEYHKKLFGRTSKEILSQVFKRELSDEEKNEFTGEKEKIYREIASEKIRSQKGLKKLLDELYENDVKMAVATSATETNLEFTLDKLDIRKYFVTTTNSSEISHSKPHPEIFLKTARDMGAEPENCVVFEDSPSGVEAAHRAQMKTFVVNPSDEEKI